MNTLILFIGIWSSTCIQTQILNQSGYVRETYSIQKDGTYEFKRDWYSDSTCQEFDRSDVEAGTLEVDRKITSIFISGDAYEANWSSAEGVDAGAISVRGNKLRIARGVKNSGLRNTMLGLFEYVKKVEL